MRDLTDEIRDLREIKSFFNQARFSVNRIGIAPSIHDTTPARELILNIDREENIFQSLPSVVTLIDINQISTKEPQNLKQAFTKEVEVSYGPPNSDALFEIIVRFYMKGECANAIL